MSEFRYVGLGALTEMGLQAVTQACNDSANELLSQVVPATPHKGGALQGSEHVTPAERQGHTIAAVVSAGGEASAYAEVQHKGHWDSGPLAGVSIENHPGGGDIEYIERPFTAHIPLHIEAVRRAWTGAY